MIRSSSIQLGGPGATSRSIMRFKIPQRMFSLLAIASSVFVCSQTGLAQKECITRDDVKRFVAQINTQQNSEFNPKLRNDLLKLESESAFDQIVAKNRKDDALKKRVNKHKEKINLRLCQMLQKFGWPTASMVGQDGVGAAFDLIRTNATFELQMKLLPAIFTAGEKGEIKKQALAGLIDRLRLAAGLKQVFGTEAVIRNGFIILLPIEAERDVNARRKQYDLPPLADDLLAIQRTYRLPLMKAPATI